MEGDSWRRTQGGGTTEEESPRRNLRAEPMEEVSWRRRKLAKEIV